MRKKIYAVILVGGKGKRLRPLSTEARPKAFLSVTRDRKTMFRNTLDRIKAIIPESNILVVANKRHAGLIKKDFPGIKKGNLLLEKVSRNTAPAIALAASALEEKAHDAIMVVLPTDQYIADKTGYLKCIKRGIGFVKNNSDSLLVLTVKPKFGSTEFGYVRVKGQEAGGKNIYKVEKFTEKPDLNTAREYVKSGKYLWNTGAFIFSVNTILEAIRKFSPEIFSSKVPDISIDYAVMEKAPNIYCLKGSYRWHDMGSFESLRKILKEESRDFVWKDGKVTEIL